MKHNCKGTDIDISRAMAKTKRYQTAIKRAKKRAIKDQDKWYKAGWKDGCKDGQERTISRAIDETIKHSLYMDKPDLIKLIKAKLNLIK